MARGINDVLLIGALARDPELRYTPSGTAVLNFTIAGDSRVLGSDGLERTLPWYQRGSLMGKQAEIAAEHLKASDPVLVEGSLEYRAWETEQGQRRSKLEVKARRLEAVRPQAGPEALITDATGGFRLTDAVNRVTLLGNLTRDVELRHTPNGFAVASLSLAVTESWKDYSGQWQERTHFVDATLWRELAEAASMLSKGTPVLVTGRLTNDSWTDKDGSKRSVVKVEADRLEPLSRPARPEASQPAKPTAQARNGRSSNASAPASSTANASGSNSTRKAPPQAQAKNRKAAPAPPESEDMPF